MIIYMQKHSKSYKINDYIDFDVFFPSYNKDQKGV